MYKINIGTGKNTIWDIRLLLINKLKNLNNYRITYSYI